MPRPRSLTPARLASAGLAVIDREGLTGLSMRTVAKHLGVSTMALYRYVDDREELEGLVLELVLGAVVTDPPAPGAPWPDRIGTMVGRLRDALGAHPSVVPLTLTHRHRSPGLLRWGETVLGILAEAGFEGRRRVVALRGILGYVIGAIQLEHLGALSGEGTAVIAQLAPDGFPYMAEAARQARNISADQEFHGGLAALLRGLDG
ncbi:MULTISPECIES: TetR/AcrR family transcriptional regulator [Streptomyces]|uniref:TetR/AcrR family transcriptional regulator n=1 Tax=Streptomyces lycii TaxID=2654337 RepID=A0ABQ7FQR4_9ACTN|nr:MULTISPECIES: TetR/AcrR family transcriptional regulator [Streptomyces]KAF4410765.1 TetR/AcrR family transcriptional regulator [Streptomyces lycii]PGH50766.1 TetR family transcriptional regulator [Streptomyces sp. Ru87]